MTPCFSRHGIPSVSRGNALPVGLLVLTSIALLALAVDAKGIPPRRLGPYIEQRAAGHNPLIENAGRWVAAILLNLDRGDAGTYALPPPKPAPSATEGSGAYSKRVVEVDSANAARQALASARPGDVINFRPGTYRFDGSYLEASQAGKAGQEIVVRAEHPDSVFLEFNLSEGFLVTAPYWTFENLTIRGVCKDHSNCEHAFHVVGQATNFSARNNRISDFNAHFKINGSAGKFPDHGLIEANVLRNSAPRQTANPVTFVDLVAASNWTVRNNLIADFIKLEGDRISYGAFAKGGGMENRFERNIVVCEDRLRNYPGQRVGLSLGGGGTSKEACRDRRCITEQQRGVLSTNLIASCSDDGIYVNRAAESKVKDNTLIDTGPISVRFAESSADLEGNLVDSAIHARDDALVRLFDNRQTRMDQLYMGRHPVRDLFADARTLDLRWKDAPPRRESTADPIELCASGRKAKAAYGAFDDYAKCQSADH